MRRREWLARGALGGVLGALAVPAGAEAGVGQSNGLTEERTLSRIAEAVNALRDELRQERGFVEIAPVRSAQKQYLRANGKLPAYVDVGADVWFDIYDWHVRWRHPIAEGRDGQGRLTLAVNQTLVVLRPDVQPSYVGVPYEG